MHLDIYMRWQVYSLTKFLCNIFTFKLWMDKGYQFAIVHYFSMDQEYSLLTEWVQWSAMYYESIYAQDDILIQQVFFTIIFWIWTKNDMFNQRGKILRRM